jgi:hypothetical protein
VANFGWDLPPGCSQRDIDDAFGGGEDCEHELCPYCDGCHEARCRAFFEPCEEWMKIYEKAIMDLGIAYLLKKYVAKVEVIVPSIVLQYREIVAWQKELEVQIKSENDAMAKEHEYAMALVEYLEEGGV